MDTITIRYCFEFGKDSQEVFELQLDAESLQLKNDIPESLPDWTMLDFCQCPNCPLSTLTHSTCPVAANLVRLVDRFDSLLSYHKTHMTVTTKERMICQDTTVQRGVGSLMGLIIATSGCPHTVYFTPMARFHLPLANNHETIYRAASMYLLAQYFLKKEGRPVDFELEGLEKIYTNIQTVNYTIAARLRSVTKTDSVVNALVELDIFAQTLSSAIEESLVELRPLFNHFLTHDASGGPAGGQTFIKV